MFYGLDLLGLFYWLWAGKELEEDLLGEMEAYMNQYVIINVILS
jgi:hypothetical protein